jgi:microcystin-dependent protein
MADPIIGEPFIGEIRMFAGNFAPKGWALCNGQLLLIAQNTTLFALLGTTYGGNGTSTFALPNLQARAPLMAGQGSGLGELWGTGTVTLSESEMPAHTHQVNGSSSPGTDIGPMNNKWGVASVTRGQKLYSQDAGTSPLMRKDAFGTNGEGQPHNNLPPYLVLTFIIALQGLYPPRS